MLTDGAFEAKGKMAELLDKVVAGETIFITRRGAAAACWFRRRPHPLLRRGFRPDMPGPWFRGLRVGTPDPGKLLHRRRYQECPGVRSQGRCQNEKKPDLSGFSYAANFLILLGRGEKIRTSDPLHPMQVRYQAALRPERSAL
jgi:hypothetical protein